MCYIYTITKKQKTMDNTLLDVADFNLDWIDEEYHFAEWRNKNIEQIEAEEQAYYDELKWIYK